MPNVRLNPVDTLADLVIYELTATCAKCGYIVELRPGEEYQGPRRHQHLWIRGIRSGGDHKDFWGAMTMTPACLNIVGLITNLAGVVLLFRYGMPYRVATGGTSYFVLEETDHKKIAREAVYKRLGFLGLGLIVGGTILQVVANWG